MILRVLPFLMALALTVPANAQSKPEALPLRDVVLFSSGVGYFGREGSVRGETTVPMSFRAEQINDVLKSLVVFDPQGTVKPVTYTTKDSIGRRLQSSGMNLDAAVSLGQLLRQFQGARVRLEVRKGRAIEGRIISVSTRREPMGDVRIAPPEYSEVEYVNILTANGLAAVRLDDVTEIQLLDERLENDLRGSLELLATGLDDQMRNVMLHFGGGTQRQVRAGYLLETPVWKTTYRLVLDSKGETKPYLQGWAIVENTTDSDWQNVNLSLVSGRPISFIQDLYQPLYVPRPRVAPQIIGSPNPQTYGETLIDADENETMKTAAEANRPMLDAAPAANRANIGGGFGGGMLADAPALSRRRDIAAVTAAGMQSVQATGSERGELFEYSIAQPVTLPRQQAALVPIVGENIGGEAISIYDANDGFNRALNGFRLKNTTGLHLSGGPITVFDGGIYAGDAQMTDLQPDEERLISYAVDLDLTVSGGQPSAQQSLVSVSLRQGVLVFQYKHRRVREYSFRNKAARAKTVLVQQDIEPNFDLITPAKEPEKTADEYRFKVEVPANVTVKFETVTERVVSNTVAILNADLNALLGYSRNTEINPALRAALEEVVRRRQAISELQARQNALQTELKEIDAEQSRIRQNMAQLDRNSDLYKQYVAKFTQQETRIEAIRAELSRLREAEAKVQNELREYTSGLTLE